MLSTIFLCAFVAAPPVKKDPAKVEYPGPMGLTWGMMPAAVKEAIGSRLQFREEAAADDGATFVQRYDGEFGSLVTESIEAIFIDEKLVAFAVELQHRDEMLASTRWQVVVDKMTEAYGPPSTITPTPKIPSASSLAKKSARNGEARKAAETLDAFLAMAGGEFLDDQIRTGQWMPRAEWRFKNRVSVLVAVIPGQPDENGARVLVPTWFFAEDEALKKFKAFRAANAEQKRDF